MDEFVAGMVTAFVIVFVSMFVVYQVFAEEDIDRVKASTESLCQEAGGTVVEDGKLCAIGDKVFEIGF